MSEDYYKVLSVHPESTDLELKKAYRKLARVYHPDKNQQDEGAAEKFKQVNNAYSILSDPNRRMVYDLFGQEGDCIELQVGEKGKWNNPEKEDSRARRKRSRSRVNKERIGEKIG